MLIDGFSHLARLDLPGGGQVVVEGDYAYVGHMDAPHGTSIIDVSDPRRPKVVAAITLEDEASHSHKARVIQDGNILITNLERARRGFFRRGRDAAAARDRLRASLGRVPTNEEIAEATGCDAAAVPDLLAAAEVPYDRGGIRIWDISDKTAPRLITHLPTGGDGSHRFDCDDDYVYVSSGAEGFVGNILQIYGIADPARPEPVSRWCLPGQEIADGDPPIGPSGKRQLHHAMRCGDELWAGCWYAGVRGIDVSDIRNPRTIAEYDYHPAFPHPTHTAMRPPFKVGGRDIVLVMDEEAEHRHGQSHAFLWIFDVTNGNGMTPISTFHIHEGDTPHARNGGRFGAHQYREHFDGPVMFATWFSGGLRAIDFSDPFAPREVGRFIPDPARPGRNVQTNDVEVDGRGLVYALDRFHGLDILEFKGG